MISPHDLATFAGGVAVGLSAGLALSEVTRSSPTYTIVEGTVVKAEEEKLFSVGDEVTQEGKTGGNKADKARNGKIIKVDGEKVAVKFDGDEEIWKGSSKEVRLTTSKEQPVMVQGVHIPKDRISTATSSNFSSRTYLIAAVVVAVIAYGANFYMQMNSVPELRRGLDQLVLKQQSKYQRLVATRYEVVRGFFDYRFYLDGFLQFSSMDEHRYHEALVHPAFLVPTPTTPTQEKSVLILGGGDGLVAREVLKHDVEEVDLVDLDPAVTDFFGSKGPVELQQLNGFSLSDRRLTVHNMDALHYIGNYTGEPYDIIILDLPDPNLPILAQLFTQEFLRKVVDVMAPEDGVLVAQASSPFSCREAFWCIYHTLQAAAEHLGGMNVLPYTVTVPSFGAQVMTHEILTSKSGS
jgi:spermidine synthase